MRSIYISPPVTPQYQIVELNPFQLGSTFQANGVPLEMYAAFDSFHGQVLMAHELIDSGVINLNDGKAKNSRFRVRYPCLPSRPSCQIA